MKTASAKAKGRCLQQRVRDDILAKWPELAPGDVRSTSMGASGEDVQLSPAAFRKVPFHIECKNQESLNIWSALKQAHGGQENGLVVFKRNRSPVYVALRWEDFLALLP